jgi:mannose-1-phosphate guanylyltransferase
MALSESLGAELPAVGCLIGDLCLPLLRRGGQLSTLEHAGPWFDTGSMASYWRANAHWLDTRPLAADGSPQQGGNFVASDVQMPAELSVRRSLIGQGAKLIGRGAIERCVVWPGATVHAPLRDAIVLESGRVVPLGAEAFAAEPIALPAEAP